MKCLKLLIYSPFSTNAASVGLKICWPGNLFRVLTPLIIFHVCLLTGRPTQNESLLNLELFNNRHWPGWQKLSLVWWIVYFGHIILCSCYFLSLFSRNQSCRHRMRRFWHYLTSVTDIVERNRLIDRYVHFTVRCHHSAVTGLLS